MSAMSAMRDLAEQMTAVAAKYTPGGDDGMLEVVEMYRDYPDVIRQIARAWKEMHVKAQEAYPMHAAAVDLVEAVYRTQLACATTAEQIAPTIRSLHRDEIERLQDKRQAMWDQRANKDRI